jgi:hypothetical protein
MKEEKEEEKKNSLISSVIFWHLLAIFIWKSIDFFGRN